MYVHKTAFTWDNIISRNKKTTKGIPFEISSCNMAKDIILSQLSHKAFARSYHRGDSCLLNNFFYNLDKGLHEDIFFIGGSMTHGHGCLENNKKCSWPAMFSKWVHKAFPQWNLTIHNMAVGGYSSYVWSTRKELFDVKTGLAILDFTVNSAIEPPEIIKLGMENVLYGLHKSKVAVIAMETFDTCGYNMPYCKTNCAANTIKNIDGYYWCDYLWKIQDYDYEILRHFETTFASYRDAVWPSLSTPPKNLSLYWSNNTHPDYIAHSFIATVMEYTFIEELKMYCKTKKISKCTKKKEKLTETFYCAQNNITNFVPIYMDNSWKYYEDVPGKPGWINTSNTTESIIFKAKLTKQLEITYLKTYENIGETIFLIKCGSIKWKRIGKINGIWRKHASIPYTMVFVAFDDGVHKIIPVGNECLVRFDMVPKSDPINKFKIISVAGC